MESIIVAAEHGFPVLGICNGFQVLCESHLLPGALTRNQGLHFLCRDQKLKIENTKTIWTSGFTEGQEIVIPLKNGEGSFQCDDETLDMLESQGRVIARYVDFDPNGSRNLIAGITNARGNVVGLMPHPEHAIESLTGPSEDGLIFFTSALQQLVGR
jgi:phosphoribosylformylglycinamidine synthase